MNVDYTIEDGKVVLKEQEKSFSLYVIKNKFDTIKDENLTIGMELPTEETTVNYVKCKVEDSIIVEEIVKGGHLYAGKSKDDISRKFSFDGIVASEMADTVSINDMYNYEDKGTFEIGDYSINSDYKLETIGHEGTMLYTPDEAMVFAITRELLLEVQYYFKNSQVSKTLEWITDIADNLLRKNVLPLLKETVLSLNSLGEYVTKLAYTVFDNRKRILDNIKRITMLETNVLRLREENTTLYKLLGFNVDYATDIEILDSNKLSTNVCDFKEMVVTKIGNHISMSGKLLLKANVKNNTLFHTTPPLDDNMAIANVTIVKNGDVYDTSTVLNKVAIIKVFKTGEAKIVYPAPAKYEATVFPPGLPIIDTTIEIPDELKQQVNIVNSDDVVKLDARDVIIIDQLRYIYK